MVGLMVCVIDPCESRLFDPSFSDTANVSKPIGASTVTVHVVVHATTVGAPALMVMVADAVLGEIYFGRRLEFGVTGGGMTMLNVTATVCAAGAFDVPLVAGAAELPPPPPHEANPAIPSASARRPQTVWIFMNPPVMSLQR
jgi:hypothetical protein